ncbi:chondroitinase-B domain-containing protein [Mucilaginibacter sp. PAMB04274]|uniref:chondroitinase-B domain-containing protein n=1 Tax=Mucilaginibacter sp. PAMB04274 TaxID=3138568 RepID=UPI0031F6AE4D
MKKLVTGIAMLLTGYAGFAADYFVKSEKEFTEADKHAIAGDNIIIANGSYAPWTVKFTANGSALRPIVIKAQDAGKVIFSGEVTQTIFKITGNYTQLQGLNFNNCILNKANGKNGLLIDLNNTKHSRITNCTFQKNSAKVQFMPLVIISGEGEHNQVDHCSFISNQDEQDLQVQINSPKFPTYTLISDNLFSDKDKVSWKVFNGGECVQIGQDPVLKGTAMAKTTVRNNQFIRCNGEGEVISNKSSGNNYTNNYFEDCQGELVMRGGHDCLIDSNQIKGGTGGIRINGSGHVITNNIISGVRTGIRLMYGMSKGKTETGFYVAATNCVISNNHISKADVGILVGDNKNQDWTGKFDTNKYPSRVIQDIPPADNQFKNNDFTDTKQTIVYK